MNEARVSWVLWVCGCVAGATLLLFAAALLSCALYIHYIHRKYAHIPSPKRSSFFLGHFWDVKRQRRINGEATKASQEVLQQWATDSGRFFVVFYFWTPVIHILENSNLKELTGGTSTALCRDNCEKMNLLQCLVPQLNKFVTDLVRRLTPLADGRTPLSIKKHYDAVRTMERYLHLNGTKTKYQVMESYNQAMEVSRDVGRKCYQQRIGQTKDGRKLPNDVMSQLVKSAAATCGEIIIDDLVDNFIDFHYGGTVAVLSLLMLLIGHQRIVNQVVAEIDEVLGTKRSVDYEDLEKLEKTGQIVLETMLLYQGFQPHLLQAAALRGGTTVNGCCIPGGTSVMYHPTTVCHIPELFHMQERCCVRPEDRTTRQIPDCIGRHFAMTEAKLVLSRLLQSFAVTLHLSLDTGAGPCQSIEESAAYLDPLKDTEDIQCVLAPRKYFIVFKHKERETINESQNSNLSNDSC